MNAESLKNLTGCVENSIRDLRQAEEYFLMAVKQLEEKFTDYSVTLDWDNEGTGECTLLKVTHLPSGNSLCKYPSRLNSLWDLTDMVNLIFRTLCLANGMKYELF